MKKLFKIPLKFLGKIRGYIYFNLVVVPQSLLTMREQIKTLEGDVLILSGEVKKLRRVISHLSKKGNE